MVVSKFNGLSWLGHGAGRLGLFGDGAGEVAWPGSDAVGMGWLHSVTSC